jgi:hypothetical protein
MVEHSENEIYAVTCRMENAIVNDSSINPVYMMGALDAIKRIQDLMCEKVEKVPIGYEDHLDNLLEVRVVW